MRIVLTSFGTTGDIQPFLALAVELRRHQHEPILALSPNYASRVTALGLPFVPIGPDLHDVQRDLVKSEAEDASNVQKLYSLLDRIAEGLPAAFQDLSNACRDADMLVSLPELPIGRMVHELTGIPFVSISIVYYVEPERGGPLEQYVASFINPFRQQLGLSPVNYPQTSDGTSPELALFAISRHIPRPEIEWPEHYHTTGFFFLDDEAWQPDQALTEFLAADEPPIVISLGSMVHNSEQELFDLFLTAIEQVGCRAIIQDGWGGLVHGRQLSSRIHTVGYVPHRWLFARATCVVHHTGIGTAASVFRAGVPSICIPHAYEQFAIAQFAHVVGCAGPPIPYRQLTLERLRWALQRTLNNPRYLEAAQRLGNKIRSESGVQTARLLIERFGRRM